MTFKISLICPQNALNCIGTNSDPFRQYVAEDECVYMAVRTENSSKMEVNSGIRKYLFVLTL